MEKIRFFLIDQMGMVIGAESDKQDDGEIKIDNPLIIAPGQNGGFGMNTHPFFEDHLICQAKYIIARSVPKQTVIEQYNSYVTKKKSGIILPGKADLIK